MLLLSQRSYYLSSLIFPRTAAFHHHYFLASSAKLLGFLTLIEKQKKNEVTF
jgi:hypothetical protein